MKVTQIAEILNSISDQYLGKKDLVEADLSNIVDAGKELLGTTDIDNYTKTLLDRIGKVVFVNRKWSIQVPSVLMDSWEYGSVVEKIQNEEPKFTVNKTWGLEDGSSYDPNVFHAPKVSAKFFNSKVTFSIEASFARRQVMSSLGSASEAVSFFSMLETNIQNSMALALSELVMETINSMVARTLLAEYPDGNYTAKSTVKAVNLLALYNSKFATSLTIDKALTTPEFIRFATMYLKLYIDRLGSPSTLFNIGKKKRQTLGDRMKVVMLSEFKSAADVYLQSDTFNNAYTALPGSDVVPFWQGPGTNYEFANTSKVKVKLDKKSVDAGGIIAIMFDREALGVSNLDQRTYSNFNPVGEFYNNFYKADAGYFNDTDENFVVFFIA